TFMLSFLLTPSFLSYFTFILSFCSDPPPPDISLFPLHVALPIFLSFGNTPHFKYPPYCAVAGRLGCIRPSFTRGWYRGAYLSHRSEEHTSELQSRFDLVCRLLLEKKKNKSQINQDKYIKKQ